jgi:hypothetical protein
MGVPAMCMHHMVSLHRGLALCLTLSQGLKPKILMISPTSMIRMPCAALESDTTPLARQGKDGLGIRSSGCWACWEG